MVFNILRCKNSSLQEKLSLGSLLVMAFRFPDTVCEELPQVNLHVCRHRLLLKSYPDVRSAPDAVGEDIIRAGKRVE